MSTLMDNDDALPDNFDIEFFRKDNKVHKIVASDSSLRFLEIYDEQSVQNHKVTGGPPPPLLIDMTVIKQAKKTVAPKIVIEGCGPFHQITSITRSDLNGRALLAKSVPLMPTPVSVVSPPPKQTLSTPLTQLEPPYTYDDILMDLGLVQNDVELNARIDEDFEMQCDDGFWSDVNMLGMEIKENKPVLTSQLSLNSNL